MKIQNVYIVVRTGPEWTDIIEVFDTKKGANVLADAKNKHVAKLHKNKHVAKLHSANAPLEVFTGRRSAEDVTEGLSHYKVERWSVKTGVPNVS